MQERGIRTRHPLELIVFQNEEGGTVGSRALVGELKGPDLDLGTKSGKTIRSGISFIGGNPDRLDEVTRKPGDLAAYVELHIEQGGSLHADGIDIGVVEGIVGIGWWDVTIDGFANHAGTTAMNNRRDAMLAFARFTDMVNRVITSEPGRQVGTVGKVFAFPGAPNVVPGKVMCSLEIRELDNARIASFFDRIKQEAEKIGTATGTTFAFQSTHDSKSALTDPRIQQVITNVAAELKLTSRPMPSGAGHDAQHMAHLCPSGMIFIPSIDGISHAPKEFSRPADVGNGANVLLRTLLSLDEQFAG
jgi:N-carbamoyl-L-amino-acid hydrolase